MKYYKMYTKDGKTFRVKCGIPSGYRYGERSQILIKFKHVDDTQWMYHVPNKIFSNCLDILDFLRKNIENDHMIFKIVPLKTFEVNEKNGR